MVSDADTPNRGDGDSSCERTAVPDLDDWTLIRRLLIEAEKPGPGSNVNFPADQNSGFTPDRRGKLDRASLTKSMKRPAGQITEKAVSQADTKPVELDSRPACTFGS